MTMDNIAAGAMIVMGAAIAGVWTRDIVAGARVDLSGGILAARDSDGTLLWPHWLAEYATAVALMVAAVAIMAEADRSPVLTGIATGALLYTSINSLSWALSERDRSAYAIPMVLGVVVGLFLVVHLLVS